MRGAFDTQRAVVATGDGVVARFPGILCVARCADPGPVRHLLELCASTAGAEPGHALARGLATWLSGPEAPGPALRFGTLAAAGEHLAVFLVGAVDAWIDGQPGSTLSGAYAAIGTDRLVAHPATPVVLSIGELRLPPDVDNLHDLRAGVVEGGGVVLHPAARPAAGPADAAGTGAGAASPDATADHATAGGPAVGGSADDTVAFDAPPTAAGPAPVVQQVGPGTGSPAQVVDPPVTSGQAPRPTPRRVPSPGGLDWFAARPGSDETLAPGSAPVGGPGGRNGAAAVGGVRPASPPWASAPTSSAAPHDPAGRHAILPPSHRPDDERGSAQQAGAAGLVAGDAGPEPTDVDDPTMRGQPHPDVTGVVAPGRTNGHAPAGTDERCPDPRPVVRPTAAEAEAAEGVDGEGVGAGGVDGEGFDAPGFDAEGLDPAGVGAAGVGAAGFDAAGVDAAGVDAAGVDAAGVDGAAVDPEVFDAERSDAQGLDAEGVEVGAFDTGGTHSPDGETVSADAPVQPGASPERNGVEQHVTTAGPTVTGEVPVSLVSAYSRQTSGPDDVVPPAEAVDTAGAAEPAEGGPQVGGYVCEQGHLNDPRSPFCGRCGNPIDGRTSGLVTGPRPALGRLVFDDGVVHTLDDGYLVGRMPEADDRVLTGALRPIIIEDRTGSVSRVHAEITISGWDVMLLDAGSRNGTFVAGPEDAGWSPLTPQRGRRLLPGTRVRLGGRTFVFESASGRR